MGGTVDRTGGVKPVRPGSWAIQAYTYMAGDVRQSMTRDSVLIVDDDLDIREILGETLAERGFDVATAANGLEALQVLRGGNGRPSVILLDLMMPVMDGYGFLEQRRQDPALASIPLAIVTAGYGIDRHRLADDLHIIGKPFNVPALVGILRALCSGTGPPA